MSRPDNAGSDPLRADAHADALRDAFPEADAPLGTKLREVSAAYSHRAGEAEAAAAQADRDLDALGIALVAQAWALHQDPDAWRQLIEVVVRERLRIRCRDDKRTFSLLRYLEAGRASNTSLPQPGLRPHVRLKRRLSSIALAVDQVLATSSSVEEAESRLRSEGVVALAREAAKLKRERAQAMPQGGDATAATPGTTDGRGDGGQAARAGHVVRQVEMPEDMAARLDGSGASLPACLTSAVTETGTVVVQALPRDGQHRAMGQTQAATLPDAAPADRDPAAPGDDPERLVPGPTPIPQPAPATSAPTAVEPALAGTPAPRSTLSAPPPDIEDLLADYAAELERQASRRVPVPQPVPEPPFPYDGDPFDVVQARPGPRPPPESRVWPPRVISRPVVRMRRRPPG